MSIQKTTETHFEVKAKVSYVEAESKPEEDYYFFAYHITIQNKGTTQAQLVSRHWIITDGRGFKEEIRGAGVIGQQPKIAAGQSFEYESACPLHTRTGSMRGYFQMLSEDGSQFEVEIPEFYLVHPQALH